MKNKEIFSFLVYCFSGLILLFSLSQIVGITSTHGKFAFGELTALFFNDSYTSFFAFPFCLGALLIKKTQKEANLYFVLSRYTSRINYLYQRIFHCLQIALKYYAVLLMLTILAGIGNSQLNGKTSSAFRTSAKVFIPEDVSIPANVFLNFLESCFAYLLLMIILVLFFMLLTQTKLNGAAIFAIFSITISINAFACLGFFGNFWSNTNLFALLLPLQSAHSFGFKILISISVIFLLFGINILLICRRDMVLPKTNKNYETE